jgi:outer membrane protein
MNRTLKSILTITAFGAAALGLSAQPAIKLITVDMGKLLEGYYKTEQVVAKLKGAEQKIQDEGEGKIKELNQLAEKYKETVDQAKNALLTPDARSKAEADSAKMLDDLQQRQTDINNYRVNSQRELQQQLNNARAILLDEISKKVTELGKGKGATVIIDSRSGLVYSDAAFDITDEAMALINKDRPAAPAPTAASAAPASSTPAASPSAAPMVTVPGLAPKN